MVTKSREEKENGTFVFNIHRILAWNDKEILEMGGGDGCTVT